MSVPTNTCTLGLNPPSRRGSSEPAGASLSPAARISEDYAEVDNLVLVGVLKGAFIFLSDLSRNLTVPKSIGMRTVLIVPQILGAEAGREVFQQHDWEAEGHDAAHVDFITDDLAAFVGAVGDVVATAAD